MPIYEYECEKCQERVEILIRSERDIPAKCSKCGGKLHKAFSSFSVSGPAAPKHERSNACASCSSGGCPYSGGAGG